MNQKNVIVFVCEHGAAKSIVASAYFNKIAAEKELGFRSIARGTHPEAELGPMAVAGLITDGLNPTERVPQKLSPADVESAKRIITFCDLPPDYKTDSPIESWEDVPAVSNGYEAARDAIIGYLQQLITNL